MIQLRHFAHRFGAHHDTVVVQVWMDIPLFCGCGGLILLVWPLNLFDFHLLAFGTA